LKIAACTEVEVKLTVEPIRLHLAHTFTIAGGSSDSRDAVAVVLEHDGITGHGAAAPNPRHGEDQAGVLQALTGIQLSGDLSAYTRVLTAITSVLKGRTSALAALEMAVMDWNGKALNVPLYRLWGLDARDMPPTSYTIGIDTPEKVKIKTREASDYQVLKVKLGGENDREMIETIRDVSDQTIRVDANEGWHDREEALREIQWLAERNVEFVEQPMPADRFDDMVWLKQRSPLPLIADEAFTGAADVPKLSQAYHGVNFKLMKGGGIQAAHDALTLARMYEMRIMLGCMIEPSISIAAAAHLGPLMDYVDLDGNVLLGNDPYHGHPIKDGRIQLRNQPGLGVEPV
jgi:L-alanine-DL-glutamate epimerase-like enolase superfamily enzyme